jgi:hypothetical protein
MRVVKNFTLENCTSTINNGDEIYMSQEFILTADPGYTFTQVAFYAAGEMYNDYNYPTGFNNECFTKDGTELILYYDISEMFYTLDAYTEGEPTPPEPDDVLLYTDIFNLDQQQLKALNIKWFLNSPGSIDHREFIYNLYEIPFNVDSILSSDTKEIVLGKTLNTEIQVDLGVIEIPEKYFNIYDYDNVECLLSLPYLDRIVLDVNKVVGFTISIDYIIDLYTRQTTINIKSTFNNTIIYNSVFEVGDLIPYKQLDNNNTKELIDRQIRNNVFNSYIELVRFIPINPINLFGKQSKEFTTLINLDGYIEISDILLNVTCTDIEKSEITNLLNSGVYIR